MLRFLTFLCFAFLATLSAYAQIEPVISAPASVRAESEVVLSAAQTAVTPTGSPRTYEWRIDGKTYRTEEITLPRLSAGTHDILLIVRSGKEKAEVTSSLFVYDTRRLLVTSRETAQIDALTAAAREKNILLTVIPLGGGSLLPEESLLISAFAEKKTALAESDTILLDGATTSTLTALSQYVQEAGVDMAAKHVALLSSGSLDSLATIARGAFGAIRPAAILVTREDALRTLTLSGAASTDLLTQEAIPSILVDQPYAPFSIFSPLTFLIHFLVASGIPASAVLLILLFPFIAMLVAFIKQVIGISTFGVYTPTLLTLSFLAIGNVLLASGILFVILTVSILLRKLVSTAHLSFIPRMAMVHTFVALAILLVIGGIVALVPFGIQRAVAQLIAAALFPMIIMSTLAEKFVTLQGREGILSTIRAFTELFITVGICYALASLPILGTSLLAHAELVLAFLVGDFLLGRYSGLRVTEYFRFRDMFKKEEEE